MALTVVPIPILQDNYAWFLRDEATGASAVVDAAEAAPVLEFLRRENGGRCDLLPITHHHADHIAEIPAVAAATGAKVAGNPSDAAALPRLDIEVPPGASLDLGDSRAEVLDTPGHAHHHVSFAFLEGEALLCGDVLFAVGCGRLSEGTAEEMWASLSALAALPGPLRVCAGHEYTLSNVKFARHVDPANEALAAFAAEAEAKRARGEPTLPTTLALERAANPFLRARDAAHFAELRRAKDIFR